MTEHHKLLKPVALTQPQPLLRSDTVASTVLWLMTSLVIASLVWLLLDVVQHGLPQISLNFILEEPSNAGREGGIAPILFSTLLILIVCLLATVPLGLATAIYLAEYLPQHGRLALALRRSLDILAGVPSIVFGLFGNVLFCQIMGMGFSILSGGLTLACMALPLFIRLAETGLRSISNEHRLNAMALGISQSGTVLRLLLPAAAPALVVGLILSIGRALAETAALVFTSGYVDRYPSSLMDSGRALSIHIFDLSMNVPGGDKAAYGSALVLVILIVVINRLASVLTYRWLGHTGK